MDDKYKNLDCRKIEVFKNYINMETFEKRPAIETMILAENKNWIDYPLVKNYTGEHARNCEYYTKVEVVLMDGEYSRRLFFDWESASSVYDFMRHCIDNIMAEIIENPDKYYAEIVEENEIDPTISLQFYSDDGESVNIEIEGERGFENRIASIRVEGTLLEYSLTTNKPIDENFGFEFDLDNLLIIKS